MCIYVNLSKAYFKAMKKSEVDQIIPSQIEWSISGDPDQPASHEANWSGF